MHACLQSSMRGPYNGRVQAWGRRPGRSLKLRVVEHGRSCHSPHREHRRAQSRRQSERRPRRRVAIPRGLSHHARLLSRAGSDLSFLVRSFFLFSQ